LRSRQIGHQLPAGFVQLRDEVDREVLSDPGLLRAFDQSQNRDAKLPAKVAQFSLGANIGDIMKERR
jgi:hypothetical protein